MRPLKIGDKVRFTSGGRDKNTIHTISDLDGRYVYLDGANSRNSFDGWYPENFAVVEPDLTPAQLADKYRALRAEAQGISKQLQDLGYQPEYQTGTSWTKLMTVQGQVFRFIKPTVEIL